MFRVYNLDKRLFNLIELFIVFAIFLIIVSLLQPSLKKIIDSAYSMTCQNNQKLLYFSSTLYSDDYNNTIVPSGFSNSFTLPSDHISGTIEYPSWDNNLSIYQNRENETQMLQHENNPNNRILRCPQDNVTGTGGWERRSYSMIGRHFLFNNPVGRLMWGPSTGVPFYKWIDLPDPQGTLLFSEYPHQFNLIGHLDSSVVANTANQTRVLENVHGPFTFNYLFTDGHAAQLLQIETEGKTPLSLFWRNLGAWSVQEND